MLSAVNYLISYNPVKRNVCGAAASFCQLTPQCSTLVRNTVAIRYDTIEEFNVTRKLSIQLYLAHVARKETKTNNASAPLIQYRLRSVKAVREE